MNDTANTRADPSTRSQGQNGVEDAALTSRFRTTYRNNPGPRLAIGLIALAAGLALLGWAIVDLRLWLVLIGGGLATVGIGLLIDWTRDRLKQKQVPNWLSGLVGGGLLLAAIGAAWSSDRWDLPFLAVVAIIAMLFGLAPLSIVVNAAAKPRPWVFVIGGFALSLGGVVLVAVQRASSMVGVTVVILGLMGYQLGLRFLRNDAFDASRHPQPDHGPRWARIVSLLAGIVAAVALSLIVYLVASSQLEISGWRAAVAGACVYVLLLALLTLSVSWTSIRLSPLDPRTVGVFGVVLAASGAVLLAMSGLTVWYVSIVIGLVVVAAGSFVVWRGEGIFIVVIVGFLVVWTVVDRTTSRDADPAADATGPTEYIVAFGDSYVSGEGSNVFFDGTDQDGNGETKNECRRAPTAYSYVIAEGLGKGLGFFACSGAKMVHINALEGDDPAMLRPDKNDDTSRKAWMQDFEAPQISQFKEFTSTLDKGDEIVAALVSIGGNEARFGDVAKGCVLPGSCDEQREVWLQNIETFGDDLVTTYTNIKEEVGAPVVVMPYPLVLRDKACNKSPLEQSEHDFLTEFIAVLNEQLRVSAARAGVYFFEEGIFAFEEHRICESGKAMNIIDLQPSDGGLVDRLSPSNWGHNSMHPTPFGHELTAARLRPFLNDVLAEGENPPPDQDAELEVLGIRTVEPLLVDLDEIAAITGFPFDPESDEEKLDGLEFGTGVLVRDSDEMGTARETKVRIADADSTTTVYCVVGGAWEGDLPEDGGACKLARTETDVVTIVAQPPADETMHTQWVMFTDRTGELQVRGLRLCSRDDRCPNNFDAWQEIQTNEALQIAVPLFLLLFAGGWLLALWFRPDRYLSSLRTGDPLPLTTRRDS